MSIFSRNDSWRMRGIAFLLVGVLRCASAGFSWHKCDESATYLLEPTSIVLTPSDPKPGDTMVFDTRDNAQRSISGGKFKLSVHYGWLPVFSDSQDICSELVDSDGCPISTGPVAFRYEHTLPSAAPHGKYKVKLTGKDDQGALLNCVEMEFSVSSTGPGLKELIGRVMDRLPVT